MNVLITGANGQLGNEIKKLAPEFQSCQFLFLDLPELDITNEEQLRQVIAEKNINALINCAAYTAVDKAENDREKAEAVNATGPELLAKLTTEFQLKFIHISTDFVFDGCTYIPYQEDDSTNPVSVYGETKLQGEQLVLQNNPNAIVIRTSWLYSAHGNNFVKTMQRLGRERDGLGVIFDQVGTPTWAGDLAAACLTILNDPDSGKSKTGIFHFSNEGAISWYDFAVSIMKLSSIDCQIKPIGTNEYPTPAKRPAYSVMNKSKIKATFGLKIPHWESSLNRCIQEIAQQ